MFFPILARSIALSASVLKEDIEKTKLVGMNYHLTKPRDPSELIEVLQKFLKSKTQSNSILKIA